MNIKSIKVHSKHGALYAISSGLCYGLMGYFGVTLINSGLSVCNMLFWRFFVATLFALLVLFIQDKTQFKISRNNVKVLLYGMLFYGTGTIMYFTASQYIGTGLSMVIFFSFPAMVMLLNIVFYRIKISKLYCLAVITMILGMLCLADIQDSSFDILGIAFGLLSAFCYASYIFVSKSVVIPPLFSTFMVSAGCMMTCLIASIIDSSFYVPINVDDWMNIIAMGLICTAIPILLLLQALKYISSEKAAILTVLEPVFVVIFGIILLGEKISSLQMLGGIIVLLGACMTLIKNETEVETA